jgi:hypothetical protein
MKRSAVREVVGRFRTANPRVFGGAAWHRPAMAATSTCWSMRCLVPRCWIGRPEEELESLLGVDVDLLTPGDLPPKFRAKVLAEAQPI